REHPPQWGCDRGATKPEPKSDATLWAAVLFGPDVVARSLQTPEGYALEPVRKHLAPCLAQKSLAANVIVFMNWSTYGPSGFPLWSRNACSCLKTSTRSTSVKPGWFVRNFKSARRRSRD